MMRKTVAFLLLAAVFAATFLMAGCSGKTVTEADVSYAGPMLDNVLAGIKDKDFGEFEKDFSVKMAAAFTPESFKSFADLLETKIGEYQSRSFISAQDSNSGGVTMTTVRYKAKYSKETGDVTITITFGEENGARKVTGYYMTSPNLLK